MKHKKMIVLFIMLGLILTPLLAFAQQYKVPEEQFDTQANTNSNNNDKGGVQSIDPFAGTIKRGTNIVDAIRSIVNLLLTLVAVITVVFIIIGGVRYIVSQGDEEATNKAKMTILYAILGLIVILISGVLVNFILRAVSG